MTLLKATLLLSAVFLEIAYGQPLGNCASESNSAFSNNLLNSGNFGQTFLNLQNANGNFNNFPPLTANGVPNGNVGNCGCANSLAASGNISPLSLSGNVNNFSPLANIANEVPNGNGNCGCVNSLVASGNISPLALSGNVNNFSPLANIVNEVPNGNGNCGCGNSIAASINGNFLPNDGINAILANAGLSGSLNYVPSSPIITEVVPNLKFGEVSCSGDLPVGGTIKVCGCFPVYGMIAVDGSVPTSGTAVIDTGNSVVTQVF